MTPYEARNEPVPMPSDCTGQPYVNNDRDGQPDEDQSGLDESYALPGGGGPGNGTGDGTGGDGSSSESNGIGDGCGCAASLGEPSGNEIWWLAVAMLGLVVQRRRWMRLRNS